MNTVRPEEILVDIVNYHEHTSASYSHLQPSKNI